VDIPWGTPVRNKKICIDGQQFYWQPVPQDVWAADLVILADENRILSNYYILLRRLALKKKVAFWGHGVNFQAPADCLGNRLKKYYSPRANWWFAYTSRVAALVEAMGFPRERISVVENAIDTRGLTLKAQGITDAQILSKRRELGIGEGPIGLYCGSLVWEKRIPFLLESCRRIRREVPSFEMIVIGAGPEADRVRAACRKDTWIHYLGPLFDAERLPYFKMADVFLIPGAIGLSILDCFALEVPPVTTEFPYHGPEREYLVEGVNGVVTKNALEPYVAEVLRVLSSPGFGHHLRQGCREGARKYTLENMVNNFADGVRKALQAD